MPKKRFSEMMDDPEFYNEADESIPLPVIRNASLEHLPFILLLDTSSSMDGHPMQQINQALSEFFKNIALGTNEEYARMRDRGEFCVIKYDSQPEVILPWTSGSDLAHLQPQPLRAGGTTAMYEALILASDMMIEMMCGYKRQGVDALMGHVFNITDGGPNPSGAKDKATGLIHFLEHASSEGDAYAQFFHVGVDGFDRAALEELTSRGNAVFDLKGNDFSKFFRFVAATLSNIGNASVMAERHL